MKHSVFIQNTYMYTVKSRLNQLAEASNSEVDVSERQNNMTVRKSNSEEKVNIIDFFLNWK